MTRLGLRLCLMLLATLQVTGCQRTDYARETVLAENHRWRVVAVGDLDDASVLNVVRFRVSQYGQAYADGRLYVVDSDHFNRRYTRRAWEGDNTVHLWSPPRGGKPIRLLVQNEGDRAIKWLRVATSELFLVLDLAPGSTIDLPFQKMGDAVWFDIEGELDNGQVVKGDITTSPGRFTEVRLIVDDTKVTARP